MYQLRDAVLRPSVAEVGTTTYDIAKMLSLDCFAATTSRVQGLPRHWHGSSRRRGHRQQRVNQRLLLSFCFFLPPPLPCAPTRSYWGAKCREALRREELRPGDEAAQKCNRQLGGALPARLGFGSRVVQA